VTQLSLFELPPPRKYDVRCVDCHVDTWVIDEFYMVKEELWPLSGYGTMLCIGCLEARLGRRLVSSDFTDCPLNRATSSRRLQSRLTDEREVAAG
jgi:hypothetical protein